MSIYQKALNNVAKAKTELEDGGRWVVATKGAVVGMAVGVLYAAVSGKSKLAYGMIGALTVGAAMGFLKQ